MTGYNEYSIIEFPDGTYVAADFSKRKAVTLPIGARAGVNTYAKPYLQNLCAEYGADFGIAHVEMDWIICTGKKYSWM